MGDLADGDLTMQAQVTEDITGAIADSMNYTIDELREPGGGREQRGRSQVTQKTAHAQAISAELLGAAERQSKEIEETTAQVLQVSRSISEVSSTADEGGESRNSSLAAADKGRDGGAELDLGHERHPRADPGDLEADQAPGRELAGDRRDRGADLRHYRADERAGAERRHPGRVGG